jgi:ankyrin repeat protein
MSALDSLAPSASLRHLRLEAKRLLRAARHGDEEVLRRVTAHHPRGPAAVAEMKLADAQLVLAREHGLPSWADLKVRVAALEFSRAGGERQRAELVDAACAWGWDRPTGAKAAVAEAMIASSPGLARKDLLAACLAGELEVVREFLDQDPELARSKLPPRDWEPLLYVSYCVLLRQPGPLASRIVAVAKLLLERGADPNASYLSAENPSYVFPALYAAIAVSHNLDLARALLEAGANPNDSQSLYHAAEQWNTDALELLVAHRVSAADISYCLFHKIDFADGPGIRWFLDHGADPNGRHPAALETPLHWAIKRTCAASAIELLLSRGSDPDARTREGHTAYPEIAGYTPLDLSDRLGRLDISELLRRHGAHRSPSSPMDDFLVACACGDGEEARQRLRADPGLMLRLSGPDRALIANVAQQNSRPGVELMLELGFDPNVGGWGGMTPFHWAACRGNRPLVRTMLARGVPMVDLGGEARTPLHQALYHRWNKEGDRAGVLTDLVAAGVPLPVDLEPTGDAELDAAVARLRLGVTP